MSKYRSLLFNVLRLVISAGLLAWVIQRAGPERLWATVQALDWRWYALAVVLSAVSMLGRAARWRGLLRAVGVPLGFGRALYLCYLGAFYNTFLPTGFGGDVMRVVEFGKGATSQQLAGTVFVDRLTGFVVLFALALGALPFTYHLFPQWMTVVFALAALGVIGASALLFEGNWLRRLTARFPRRLSLAGDAWLGKTYAVITACGQRAIWEALGWSWAFNLLHIVANGLVGVALGIDVPFGTYFVFVPMATVALLIPLTVNGLGFRETIFVTLFGQLALAADRATAFSFGVYSLDLLDGIVGGIIYLLAGLKRLLISD